MKKSQFLKAIEAAGFEVENNRVYMENDLGVRIEDLLPSKGFSSKAVDNSRGKLFTEYTHPDANFSINARRSNPTFATVDLI